MDIRQKEEIVERACTIIFGNEGGYGSINKNDNGAVSIGRIQWHGNRALNLLKTIVANNEPQAALILNSKLFDEIQTSKNWNTRIVNDAEAKQLTQLLETKEGKSAQDALAKSDVMTYINKGLSYGLENAEALIYFADGVNQYGTASSLWKNIAQAAIKKGGTLDAMYEATKSFTSNYLSRRTKVYRALGGDEAKDNVSHTPIKASIISEIQDWINRYCNAGLAVDGAFGPKSKKGIIKALQHCLNEEFNAGLAEDGVFGYNTSKACQEVSIRSNTKGTLAYIAQALLYVNGYDPQGLDSHFGPNSTKAAKAFQRDHNLVEDGCVGKLTFARLVT